ncbi:7940_t:CDS:2, partial [Acaulospora morrowiae]
NNFELDLRNRIFLLSDDSGIISDDSKKTFDEKVKVEYESQNSPSVSDDDDSNYMPSDTEESASDTDASEDNINGKDLPKIDKTAFCKTYYAIPNFTKLQLSTGRIVEDILFEFAKDMDYEQKIVRALFTDKEWNELIKDRNGVPSVPRDIAEELSKYGSKTLKELRTKVMKSYLKDDEEYDVQKHYNREWIQMTMRTLCNLFENIDTPLVRTQYEDWFTVALFGTCIDFCVRDAQLGTDIKRTDAPSLSSANRKNRRRKTNARKLIGRKIDGIIYITNRLVEIGAIEGARAFAGVSDNKYLLESFKMPKTLRDMYSDLIKAVNYDDQKADKLQVFGILHLGLYIQFARLWRAGGSICIFRKDPQSFYIDSKFSKNGLSSFIKFLKKIYQYKIIIRNNLQILNILNDDTDTECGDLLEELLKDDNEQCSTPPPVPIHFFADCENTPKKKKKKR